MASRIAKSGKPRSSGNLRIGDHWNAITIIALSQSNPLKAVAELVENSIDARAKTIVITRGKEKGQHYLRVKDDGEGVRRNADGEPDFHYVATHVCDSIKRQLKVQGAGGLQGEFGIGLLSFWTLGEELLLTSAERGRTRLSDASEEGRPELSHHAPPDAVRRSGDGGSDQGHPAGHQELQRRQDPVVPRLGAARPHSPFRRIDPRRRSNRAGRIQGRAAPVRGPTAARAGWRAAGPKRGVRGAVPARPFAGQRGVALSFGHARARQSDGARSVRAHALDERLRAGDHRCALSQPDAGHAARRHPRRGIGAPGRRAWRRSRSRLAKIIEDQQRAEEERASRDVLRSVQGALKEALLALPAEEYDWFDLRRGEGKRRPRTVGASGACGRGAGRRSSRRDRGCGRPRGRRSVNGNSSNSRVRCFR